MFTPGLPPTRESIPKNCRMSLFSHVAWLPHEVPENQILNLQVHSVKIQPLHPWWKRLSGCPRKIWLDQLKRDSDEPLPDWCNQQWTQSNATAPDGYAILMMMKPLLTRYSSYRWHSVWPILQKKWSALITGNSPQFLPMASCNAVKRGRTCKLPSTGFNFCWFERQTASDLHKSSNLILEP